MSTLLTRRALLGATLETVYNTFVAPTLTTDAILVETPDFTADMTVLTRDFTRSDLSPMPHIMGRKLAKMSFTTELRGNGSEQAGTSGSVARIARLFQACGYTLTSNAAASASVVYDIGSETNEIAWTTGGPMTNTDVIQYILDVTTPGVSGTAEIAVTSDTVGEGTAAAVVTTATPFTLGTKGLTVTPVFTGALVEGQRWVVWLRPAGQVLQPESTNFKSLSLALYLDGTEHTISGAYGTFSITADAGNYAKVKWDFTGQYVAPTDVALPTNAVFETTLPPMVQLARLNVDGFVATVSSMSFTQGNDIQPRPDVNNTDGYNGVRLVSRKPEFGIDPEADLVANHDFWGRMASATQMPFEMRIGTVVGNTVWLMAPNTQYSKMTYKDRQGIRAYDAGLAPARSSGDDELFILMA